MPRVADHEARRQQVATALWQVVQKHGLEGATIGKVAEQAKMSTGLVQHYFGTKAEMERFALHWVLSEAQRRIECRLRTVEQPASARTIIRILLAELTIPTDEKQLAEYQVVLSYSLRSLHVQDLAQEFRANTKRLQRLLADQLRRAQAEGDVAPTVDADLETIVLLCFAGGCGQQILLGQLQPEQGVAALDRLLDRLFAGQPEVGADTPTDWPCVTS